MKYGIMALLMVAFVGQVGLAKTKAKSSPGKVKEIVVSGTLKFEDQPMARLEIVFLPVKDGHKAKTVTNDRGEFHLKLVKGVYQPRLHDKAGYMGGPMKEVHIWKNGQQLNLQIPRKGWSPPRL